jgi:DNA excision repair protein ERCC-3
MVDRSRRPVVVQSDRSVLLETDSPDYPEARDLLARFAELLKSPEHVHTYRITPISLWNAAAAGHEPERLLADLDAQARYPVPRAVAAELREQMGRYGRLRLEPAPGEGDVSDAHDLLRLVSDDAGLVEELSRRSELGKLLADRPGPGVALVPAEARGRLKQALARAGYPVDDRAGYTPGVPHPVVLRSSTRTGKPFGLRDYQREAVAVFHAGGTARGGSGVIVLPCGAGKTMVGLGAMATLGTRTLVLTTSTTALRQWRDELLDKSGLDAADVGEYSGLRKEIRPVTLTTYQIMTYRRSRRGPFAHAGLFRDRGWGLVIYDEVHLLPAPVFRATADIQATRRLGLTATLVREDGREEDVFALIGPKRYDVPWRELEAKGWIAEAACTEIRVPLGRERRLAVAAAGPREQYRLAATAPEKLPVVARLLRQHASEKILVIGQFLDQLETVAREIGAPLITGRTPQSEREELYDAFREGRLPVLVVSKVANFAVDLPSASVAIQLSGTFGSRQEEAQRLGRILRPKPGGRRAHFYSIVAKDTRDQEFAAHREIFLAEQGYRYTLEEA